MARYHQQDDNMVVLTERRISRDRFELLYQGGMALVEETAHYLDGDGRKEAKILSKPASSLYAAESMRLTTRLMQVASWLLLQRAATSGEMPLIQMLSEKKKVKLDTPAAGFGTSDYDELPETFRGLVQRSLDIQRNIARIDDELYGPMADEMGRAPKRNPVTDQIDLLKTAFGSE